MRRIAIEVPCALALSMASASVLAIDIKPYVHYEVKKANFPAEYYTDVNVAAAIQVTNTCELYNRPDCKLREISFLGSIYIADYD